MSGHTGDSLVEFSVISFLFFFCFFFVMIGRLRSKFGDAAVN